MTTKLLGANKQLSLCCFILFAFSCLLYANSLNNGYAVDDVEVITGNKYVKMGLKGIPTILSTMHLQGYIAAPNETYRPLSLVVFAIEYEFFGANPLVGHFFNVVLFAGCIVLLFLFLYSLFDRKKLFVPLVAAILFAAHPIHTEVVDNIKSFDELLCFFFAFLSLHLFIRYSGTGEKKALILGAMALFLSIISKETAATFSVIIPVIFFFYKNESRRRSIQITIASTAAIIAFIGLRAWILKLNNNSVMQMDLIQNAIVGAPTTASRVATIVWVLGYYVKLLLVPYPLICDYSIGTIPYANFTDPVVCLTVALYGFLIVFSLYRLLTKHKDPWAFAIIFFLVTLMLFSNVFFLVASQMSERFTFFASEGFCVIAALFIEKWVVKTKWLPQKSLHYKAATLLIPIIIIYSLIITNRNHEWADNFTLHVTDLQKAPDNSHLNYCVGTAYIDSLYDHEYDPVAKREILESGVTFLRKSLASDPNYAAAHAEIGWAFFLAGQYDSAESHNKIALAFSPTNLTAINSMGALCFVRADYKMGLDLSFRILSIDSSFVKARYNAGLFYYKLKKYDSAIICLRKAIETAPTYTKSYEIIALSYKERGQSDSAIKYGTIAGNVGRL